MKIQKKKHQINIKKIQQKNLNNQEKIAKHHFFYPKILEIFFYFFLFLNAIIKVSKSLCVKLDIRPIHV